MKKAGYINAPSVKTKIFQKMQFIAKFVVHLFKISVPVVVNLLILMQDTVFIVEAQPPLIRKSYQTGKKN